MSFGFGRTLGTDFVNELKGFVPTSDFYEKYVFKGARWRALPIISLAIGQGELLVTPIQMVRMISVFANKGFLVTPYVVNAVDGKLVDDPQRKIISLDIKESTIDAVRRGLRGVTEQGGTASILNFPQITVAGKTGTAQNPSGAPHGWFVGFFPYEKPRYAMVVFLEHGVAGYMSSLTAKEIISRMLKEGLLSEGGEKSGE